jgi:fumarate reductase (CoM/CoB) subunit A
MIHADIVETDVLVIGGGGAGFKAAIESSNAGVSDAGVSVTLALKVRIGSSGATPIALGGIAAVGLWHERGDSKEVHFTDTIKGGAYLNERKLVKILVEES